MPRRHIYFINNQYLGFEIQNAYREGIEHTIKTLTQRYETSTYFRDNMPVRWRAHRYSKAFGLLRSPQDKLKFIENLQ
jgi:hypothetical protein